MTSLYSVPRGRQMEEEMNAVNNALVFVIDDDESTREVLKAFYLSLNYRVQLFACAIEALEAIHPVGLPSLPPCDLVVCDLKMPKLNGLQFLDALNKITPSPPVILLTAHGSLETSIQGRGKGAFDFLSKPINFNELSVLSDRAIKIQRMENSYQIIEQKLFDSYVLEGIIGKSPQMLRMFDFIKRVSQSSCNVLVTGESGTGKELVVRAIHSRGPRAKKPLIAINCSAIPESLLESELFGHAKGAFTGATERRRGLLEEANEGTLFLDEIGDMPFPLQAKLLRFLQDRKVKAVGENSYRDLDVRIIAATHQDLKEAIKQKKFREDLYYRLCVAPIEIPPLRQRDKDIVLLAKHFLTVFAKKTNSKALGYTEAAEEKLMKSLWPGNVRELENTVERALLFCDKTFIDENDIQLPIVTEPQTSHTSELFSQFMSLELLERKYIGYVLDHTGNKREKAAELLGINRKTLYRKERELKISSQITP
jgi:two-component system response regulator HydG